MEVRSMHPVTQQWAQFKRRYSSRRLGVWAALTAYPATIGTATITFAVVAARDVPAIDLPVLLATDGFVAVLLLFAAVLAVGPYLRTRRIERRWFTFAAELSGELSQGRSLLQALTASARTVFDATDTVSTRIEAGIAEGVPPNLVLAHQGCPAGLVEAIGSCQTTGEVVTVLDAEIERYQAGAMMRLDRLERTGRPVATAIAGSSVVWLVVRIVIPLFIDRFSAGGRI
jgi:hypothetical protein